MNNLSLLQSQLVESLASIVKAVNVAKKSEWYVESKLLLDPAFILSSCAAIIFLCSMHRYCCGV